MKTRHTITALAENETSVLHRITSIFTKRKINIESLTAGDTEHENISRFTVVFSSELGVVPQLLRAIQKQVEIIEAFASEDEGLLYREIALLCLGFRNIEEREQLVKIVETNGGQVLLFNRKSIVVEITGGEIEINRFRDLFLNYKLYTFIRSGRVAVKKYFD
ncbi:MAG: acetolactate synthase small subunit [Deltaproteobacteria bacterium]|jgi:acetolactate synthase-1/3 small subunit|nr:acetolactate synthase small subunit [Deltaproteobacteria bacterium]